MDDFESNKITLVTPPDLYLGGNPKIFLYGNGNDWKNQIITYANANLERFPITFYYVDEGNTEENLIQWVYQNMDLCDINLVYLSNEFFDSENLAKHLILGHFVGQEKTWIVVDDLISEYIQICEHLSPNLIDNDPVRQLSNCLQYKYINKNKEEKSE